MKVAEDSVAGRQLAALIDRNRGDIERRWLARAKKEAAGSALSQLRDGLLEYLEGLTSLLAGPSPARAEKVQRVWRKVAREHGITRARVRFDIGQLIHELVLLRHEIQRVGVENGVPMAGPDAILADVLDATIAAAVSTYVEARDMEARRLQAAHVAFLTHELRNPLAIAMLTASLLRRHLPPDERTTLEKLDRSHRRLSEMIDEVLLTEQLTAGEVTVRSTDVDLGEVVDAAVGAARAMAERKGLGFQISGAAGVRVRLDPLLTRAAVQNLAENAARFANSGEVQISVELDADDVLIHFRDECGGLPPQALRSILEPTPRPVGAPAGSGLGLLVARRAIEAQGGSVHAESAGLRTCHFWIRLPRRPSAPEA
jgi:signal transduction histidine kinase